MHKKELLNYTRQYLPYEREAVATEAWSAYQEDDTDHARSIIREFYDEAVDMAREDTRAFDVRALAEDHDAVLVSAIRTYGNLGPFRPQNREDFKGVRLFDILLRPNQIACCSTVIEGDAEENLYGDWGVILGEGIIHQAFPYDATTSVSKGEIQSKFAPRLEGMRPTEQIQQALRARHIYNEVNASIGGIAGIFYCIDEGSSRQHDFPSPVFRDLIAPLGIPQYLLRAGKFYLIDSLEAMESNDLSVPMSPTQIVKQSVRPTETQRNEMIDYLVDNLTLAPRNSITSGVARGQFAYDYRQLTPAGKVDHFFREQDRLIRDSNKSLRLYGAMALHAFAEAAQQSGDGINAERARKLAESVLQAKTYESYKSRILSSGNLSITKDDFHHYLDTEELPEYLRDH